MKRFWGIALAVFVLDHLIKWLTASIEVRLWKDLALRATRNYGAGFGILQHQTWLLLLISAIVLVGIIYYFHRFPENIQVPLALIFGGTLGNFLDRLFLGYVRDFISIWIWPAFNVADIAITVGIIWIVGEELLKK